MMDALFNVLLEGSCIILYLQVSFKYKDYIHNAKAYLVFLIRYFKQAERSHDR